MLDKGHGFLNDKSPSQDCLLSAKGEEEDEEEEEEEEMERLRRKIDVRTAMEQSFTNQGFEDLDGISDRTHSFFF